MAIAAAVYHIWRPRNTYKFSKMMLTEEQMVKRIFFFGNKMENRGLCALKGSQKLTEVYVKDNFFVAWL